MSVLSSQRRHALLVPHGLLIGELALYLCGTRERVREPVTETQLSVLGAGACLPYF
jgi:hypothetical protein